MCADRNRLAELIASLKRQRDELNLQIHLGKAEAKEEWRKVTARLDELLAEYEPLKNALNETTENVFSAMKRVGEEVRTGFERVRKSLE